MSSATNVNTGIVVSEYIICIMDVQYNTACYRFETVNFDRGIYDDFVDCTYIIHLEGNGRDVRMREEIGRIPTTKIIHILNNAGYKQCEKRLIDQAPYQDLTDAFLQCFKHAKENAYGNILIFEDDFILSPKIRDPLHINRVGSFVKSRKDEEFVYLIGALPIAVFPTAQAHTYRACKTFCMHSVIYSEKLIQQWDKIATDHKHWDAIINSHVRNRYIYGEPLCYQTFPETENKRTWAEKDGAPFISWIKNAFIRAFDMDKDPNNGFAFLYFFAKFWPILIVLSILVVLLVAAGSEERATRRLSSRRR